MRGGGGGGGGGGGAVAVGRFNQWGVLSLSADSTSKGGLSLSKRDRSPPWLRASAGEGAPRDAPNTRIQRAAKRLRA